MSNKNCPINTFEEGNDFFKISNPRKPRLFATPEELWKAACGYFEYCVKNPVPHRIFWYKKLVTRYNMRPMSLTGLCMYIGISTLKHYEKLPCYDEVVTKIKQVIHIHNFTGAAAGLLKGQIIGWTLRGKTDNK